jgi:hypothetical protein
MADLADTFCSAGPANWLNYSRLMPRRSDISLYKKPSPG